MQIATLITHKEELRFSHDRMILGESLEVTRDSSETFELCYLISYTEHMT